MIQDIRKRFLFYIITIAIVLPSCAHLDSQTPGWDEFTSLSQTDAETRLHYEEHGSGDPMLFIHGFGVTSFSWRHLVSPLSRKTRIILLDLKGFGDSAKPKDSRYSVYDQARLVYQFIVEHDLRELTIVGHSYGGGVALVTSLYLSQKAPERLRRLILIDSMGYQQKLPSFIKILATPILGPLTMSLVPKKRQVRSVTKLAYYDDTKISSRAVDAYSKPLHMPGAKHAMLKTARQIIPSDIEALANRYKQLTIPTLIIWGAEDAIIPLAIGKRLNSDIPNSTLVVIEQCGHIPHEEQPAKTLRLINHFLDTT